MTSEATVPTYTTETAEDEQVLQKPNIQKLSSSGTVSFKLQLTKAPSTGLLVPLSGFEEEAYSDDVNDDTNDDDVIGEVEVDEGGGEGCSEDGADEQEHPPSKKQRLEDCNDEIGNTVQVSLCVCMRVMCRGKVHTGTTHCN